MFERDSFPSRGFFVKEESISRLTRGRMSKSSTFSNCQKLLVLLVSPSANFSALYTIAPRVACIYTYGDILLGGQDGERKRERGRKGRERSERNTGMKGHQRESDEGGDVVSPGIGCPVIESLISLRSPGRGTL